MKKMNLGVPRAVAAALMLSTLCLAAAPAQGQPLSSAADEEQRALRGFFSLGLTRGGDTVAVVGYVGLPETTDVRAGGQVDLRAGADYRLGDSPFFVQAGVGYFTQAVSGVDGRVTFVRYPLELIGLWRASERVRVGLGVRRVGDGKLEGKGVASGLGTITFKGKVGAVVEGEWVANRSVGFALRYVAEQYTAPNGEKVDGNHVGLRLSLYF